MSLDKPADEPLRAKELVPHGHRWSGLLFDSPRIGLAAALPWSFTIEFDDVALIRRGLAQPHG
jgi:hypothetical protein